VNSSLANWWLLAKFARFGVEIGVPRIERLLLRSEIALEMGLSLGNDAPTTGIFVKKDSRYLCTVTIAKNDFVRGHEHVAFMLAQILAWRILVSSNGVGMKNMNNLLYCFLLRQVQSCS
jgi:hypothetical protein